MRVALFLALTIAGALAATVAAATGAPPALLSGALVVTFLAFACAAGAAAVALHAPDDLREPREPHGPTAPTPIPPETMSRPVFGRLDENNVLVTHDRLVEGAIETVFPQGGVGLAEAAAVLIRVDPVLLQVAGEGGAAPGGYVAFSKVCTHAGCPVALYRHASHELYCPCHQSRFDVLHGARNISGPAPRPLPQLALDVDAQGYLVARGDYNTPVGPDDWDRPA